MELKFKTMDGVPVDIVPYVKKKLVGIGSMDIELFVGCDSQTKGRYTTYACVVVLHDNRGGHVVYATEKVERIRDRFSRLWKEVTMSVDVAKFLQENGIRKTKFIDLDLNPDPKYKSNQVLRSAMGYVESMGFTPRCKPDSMSATHIADKLCKV